MSAEELHELIAQAVIDLGSNDADETATAVMDTLKGVLEIASIDRVLRLHRTST